MVAGRAAADSDPRSAGKAKGPIVSRMTFVVPAVLVLAGLATGEAAAQGLRPNPGVGVPTAGPTLSPYFNLLRAGNTPALNYFGLVRPQFQTNAGLQTLEQQVGQSQVTGQGESVRRTAPSSPVGRPCS